jgi:hypothetical protein
MDEEAGLSDGPHRIHDTSSPLTELFEKLERGKLGLEGFVAELEV